MTRQVVTVPCQFELLILHEQNWKIQFKIRDHPKSDNFKSKEGCAEDSF